MLQKCPESFFMARLFPVQNKMKDFYLRCSQDALILKIFWVQHVVVFASQHKGLQDAKR